MDIKLHEIPIQDIFEGFKDDQENGVVGYGGRLNIRPAFQREFVYDDKKRNAVISSIKQGFPLNTMYWSKSDEDRYELLDGQQRTISICKYLDNVFEHDGFLFAGLTEDTQEKILNYKLMIYICEGTETEKLDWFKIINIAGEPLTAQELRNAVYTGEWLTDAKKYFSKNGCPAQLAAKDYLKGSLDRQEYLESALKWVADRESTDGKKKSIETYMAEHQMDKNASALWDYFNEVITWTKKLFPEYRKEMKGIEWGYLYNQYSTRIYNSGYLKTEVNRLMLDEEIGNKKGIYQYLLSQDEKYLNLRAFPDSMKRSVYEKQNGRCIKCGESFAIEEMQADHITPWSLGGKTELDNCQMLCADCNRRKSNK